MNVPWMIACCFALIPAVGAAQIAAADLTYLRSKAVAEGTIEVKVITRVVAARPPVSRLTDAQRIEEQRAQHNLVISLVRRGLLDGNHINLHPDGSFTLRVLPEALDHLAASSDVAALDAATDASAVGR